MNLVENALYCDYCLTPFKVYYIKCNDCRNISLCIKCFSYGVQGGTHKKYHSYSIKMPKFISNIFNQSNWNSEDERRLLESIELYGVGNWIDVSEKVDGYTADECRKHYFDFYINSSFGKRLLAPLRKRKVAVTDHSVNYTDNIQYPTLSPSLYEILPPCSLNADDQVILGYMPKRDDFERDYDNDAESILCRLKPDFKKDELLDALKVAHVGIYNQRLQERQRRKLIAREHDIIGPIMACILNKRWKPPTLPQLPTNSTTGSQILPPNERPIKKKGRPATRKIFNSTFNNGTNKNGKSFLMNDDNQRIKPYDAFLISDHLKPFLRYLNYSQARALLENLYKEEMMKFEINTMIEGLKKGKRKIIDTNTKYPKSSIFVSSRPRLALQFDGSNKLQNGLDETKDICGQKNGNILKDNPVDKFKLNSTRKRRRKKCNSYFVVRKQRKKV